MKKKNPEFTELGLEAIEINGEWHYVKEKVNTEVVRLRAELTECERRYKYYQNLTELAEQSHLRELNKRDAKHEAALQGELSLRLDVIKENELLRIELTDERSAAIEAAEEIERLRAELVNAGQREVVAWALQAELASAGQREVGAWAERDQYLESNVKLVKEIERLQEALKPFADAHKDLLENWGREDFVLISLARRHQDIRITIADFGRAHAALASSPEEKA